MGSHGLAWPAILGLGLADHPGLGPGRPSGFWAWPAIRGHPGFGGFGLL